MMYVWLVVGFVLLIKGADFFVDGSSAAAKMLKIPPLIIGMTIVSMGTSLPETSVSVSAALADKNELAVSNAVGSNIFNLMVVCGICAILCPMAINKATLKRDFPISIAAAGLLMGLGSLGMTVGHLDGAVLLVLFLAFLLMMILSARKSREEAGEGEDYKTMPVWKLLVFMIGGIAAIAVGGKMVVESASDIAREFGMSDNLIGLTIVAMGTSLPELVTSIVAARKNEVDMALGNVVGSNIFNILFVLGIASAISPISFSMENVVDTAVLIVMSVIVLLFAASKKKLVRAHGIAMLLMYAAYTVYIIARAGIISL
ncbi:MAG: calcium/sodium antiporter [Ruminococcus sp.]|nr:calcium/sodium antiporter [Ruminococcus sp.]